MLLSFSVFGVSNSFFYLNVVSANWPILPAPEPHLGGALIALLISPDHAYDIFALPSRVVFRAGCAVGLERRIFILRGALLSLGMGPWRFSSKRLAPAFQDQPFRLTRLIMPWAGFNYPNGPLCLWDLGPEYKREKGRFESEVSTQLTPTEST